MIHLFTHPFAIVLVIAGAAVGLGGWAVGAERLERWGIISLLLAGIFAMPSYATGIAAADVVSQRTFIQPSVVQTHRTWATWAAVSLVTSGIFAGFSISQPTDGRLRRFVLLVGALAAVLTGFAANRGGRIQHGERRAEVVHTRIADPRWPASLNRLPPSPGALDRALQPPAAPRAARSRRRCRLEALGRQVIEEREDD